MMRQVPRQRATSRQKGLIIIGATVLGLTSVLGVVGWLLPKDFMGKNSEVSAASPQDDAVKGESAKDESAKDDSVKQEGKDKVVTARGSRDLTGMKFKVDKDGMIKIPVTSDPVEFAAAAVSAMYTFDGAKMPFRQQWEDKLIPRLAKPSPDYVGAQVTEKKFGELKKRDQIKHLENILHVTKSWEMSTDDDYMGWASANIAWIAQPYEAWVEDEIKVVDKDYFSDSIYEDYSKVTGLPESAFTEVWVTVDVKHKHPDGNFDQVSHKPTFGVLVVCDPPEQGGICGMFWSTSTPEALRSVKY